MRQSGEFLDDFDGSNNGVSPRGHCRGQNEDGNFTEPQVGMEFDSEDAARIYYEEYARQTGFRTRVNLNPSRTNGMASSREFICFREKIKKRAAGTCEAVLRIEVAGQNKWVVTKFVKEHTHVILSPNKVHRTKQKRLSASVNNKVANASQSTEFIRSGMMYVSLDGIGNNIPTEVNHAGSNTSVSGLNNMVPSMALSGFSDRRRTLGKDAQNLLDYLKKRQAENPGFFYAIQLDEENRMANAFWADARSRIAYSHFGDAVILKTAYRVNQCIVPFAPFTGVNHHGQQILFGCALLVDESQATFVWLFRTFMAAMNNQAPVSLTTDNHKAIEAAVAQVFPRTRHCVNKWDVLREGQERMAKVCLSHPNFQVDLYNCINMTDTIEEFESCWNSLIFKYGLKRNDWLQSIYDARQLWVPVYFRDTFFAAIYPGIGFESSFFDGYVNQQTMLPMFFRQYERALENSFDREVEADFDTTDTTLLLRTPSPMEKQAASVYTKRIFSKFQEELVETFVFTATRVDGNEYDGTYRVAKFEDDKKSYFVTLNIAEMKANCSCRMFMYCGILCRHVLTVFTVTNILTLPCHYILKRWTRNAKSMAVADENELTRSLTTRYNSLCKEAMRFAEESSISSVTYSAALASLREGVKNVASVKKTVAKVANSSSRAGGGGHDDQRTGNGIHEMTPSLWPRQDEITQRFNLNDAGAPCQPFTDPNFSCLAPVSLNHLGAHSDSMVVLPCLKSMTWMMENNNSIPANKVAVINLKLQDYGRIPAAESELKFSLSKVTLEPMLRSMAYISEQLSTPTNKVAVINLKLQDTETTTGESEVKFQVSRDTLGAMLRSMAYIREQLSITTDSEEHSAKKPRK